MVLDSPAELLLNSIMLSLRTADGLNLTAFTERFGRNNTEKCVRALLPFTAQNLVTFHDSNTTTVTNSDDLTALPHINSEDDVVIDDATLVRLTDPKGFLLSNLVISSVFAAF